MQVGEPVEPPWVQLGRMLIGVREIPGKQHNPVILQMWRDIKRGGIQSDEVPWCAAFVGSMLEHAHIPSSRFESASSYLQWGRMLTEPALGCVVVFERTGGGHVGFVVGQDAQGNLLVLGGNQGDRVSIAAFPRSRVKGYRWPIGVRVPAFPLSVASADLSRGEA